MADADYINIGDSLTAQHWNALYTEAQRRLNFHYNHLSPFLWDSFDSDWRFLARRRYYVFGSTPLKKFGVDQMNNLAEYVLAAAYAGAYLPTSEDNDFFRDYDMLPFDTAETACFLRNTPRPDDARPRTSSLGPTALVSLDTFNDAFTASVWPISGSQSRPTEYVRSFYYSPKAHRKFFTFGPEYSGSQYYCYLTVDGAINTNDVPPVDEQPGTEHVSAFNPAEWLIFENGGSWTFPSFETKERFHRIHNFDNQVLAVDFAGTIWSIPPGGCLAVRRNSLTEFAKLGGGDGVNSSYFWRFQTADPRILHPTQIVGPPLVAGSALDQNGNNLTDPLMLNALMYYLLGGNWGDPDMAVYDVSHAADISSIYNNPLYATHSRAAEVKMPTGGFYGSISDESTPVGDFIIHKGKLMFVSTNTQRNRHSQSFTVTPSDTFSLFRTEDGRVALEVQDIQVFSASVSIPQFGPSFNWTSSTNITGTGSVFFTSSAWAPGQTVLSTFTSRDPDNWHTENYAGLNSLADILNRNSMSLVDASGYTSIAGTYFISSPVRDVQIVQNSTNFCTYFANALAVDPHSNPSASILNYLDAYVNPTVPFVTAITQSDEKIDWMISNDGVAFGYANPVTTSNQLQNLWRAYSSSITPANTTCSLFGPLSTVLNPIRNYGGADNQCTINADLMMTPFGPVIITNATVPVDWPLINGRYQNTSWDDNPNFWLPLNYNSHSNADWYFTRGQPLGYYAGNLIDPGTGWSSPGNWRGGETCTPRIKRAYGTERSFTHDPSQSNFVISGSTSPYVTTENARLKSYWENQPFLNYESPNNNWTGTIACGPTYNLDDIAFVGPFATSPDRIVALNAWKNKTTASYNGGFLDYGPGTGREVTYYPNNKNNLLTNGLSSDDQTLIPQVLHLTAEHFNIAASSVNHSAGTRIVAGDYQPSAAIIINQLFPPNTIGRGFTQMNRQFAVGAHLNIRPRTCWAMWDKSLYPDLETSMSVQFGVSVKTKTDFPDQVKFAAATNQTTVTKWAVVDGSGNFVITDYYDYPTNTASQSLWTNTGSIWTNLYPLDTGFFIHPDNVRWLDFDAGKSIASQMGVPFYYQDLALPLAFDYVQTPTATNLNNDNSGYFGGSTLYACSALGWYNDPNGEWVCNGDDGLTAPPSGGFDVIFALRADISPIVKLQAVMGGIGGNLASLIEFDYGRLPEKWDNSIGSYMPFIADYPYCTVGKTGINQQHDAWGNQAYLYRHYGPDGGVFRGRALIWPRNFADWQRNHVTTVNLHGEFLNFLNYPTTDAWFSIPRNVSNGISGPPRPISFTEDETIISATDLGYAYMEILTDAHWFADD